MTMEAAAILNLDVSPLQRLLVTLAQQVEKLQVENQAIREELSRLKVESRLEILETGLQELAEQAKAAPALQQAQFGQAGGAGFATLNADGTTSIVSPDAAFVVTEFTSIKERVSTLERRSEALWHVHESGEQVRALVDRLKTDVEVLQTSLADAQGSLRHANQTIDRLEGTTTSQYNTIQTLNDRISRLESDERKSVVERREAGSKAESQINSLWDQIRHVENSLSQRLTLAETSQVSTLQEVDEQKEAANELLVKLEEAKRHTSALENKLDSFNTQVAAAISPLHSSLANIQVRLEELSTTKQDTSKAITMADVDTAAARAVDHADRRADNIIKSLSAMEERIEGLDEAKASLSDVVLAVDLEALLAAHDQQTASQLLKQKDDIMKAMSLKADREELLALEAKQGARLGVLEAAILKGLKSISEKVAAALSEKLDLTRFSEFKVQVRAILADVEDRLRDFSPAARGMKSPLDGTGAQGATSCLCCDSRVRNARDLQAMGFTTADRVFSPEKLPATEPLLPSISRSPDIAAYNNAKLMARKKDAMAILRASVTPPGADNPAAAPTGMLAAHAASQIYRSGGSPAPTSAPASVGHLSAHSYTSPSPSPGGTTVAVAQQFPAGALPAVGGALPIAKYEDSISGSIGAGKIPDTRNPGRVPSKNARPPSGGVAPWQQASAASIPAYPSLVLDSRSEGSSVGMDKSAALPAQVAAEAVEAAAA